MNTNKEILKNLIANKFFTIDNFIMEYDEELQKEFKMNYRIKLKTENWNEYKETFYNQRFDAYKDKGFTKNQIINFEITETESLPNENKKYIALKENYTQLLNEKLKSKEDNPEQTKKQIKFKPTDFNKDGFELFSYLIENYVELTKETGQKKRLSNVWHFMKNDNEKKDAYKFHFTKDDYKKYIFITYGIKITNTDKSPNKYAEKDLPSLKGLRIQFEGL
jgi:hypothetical protein